MKEKSITRILIDFSIPLILSGLLQQLFNWADAFILGLMDGETAVAAIGATTSITNAFIALITGFTAGLTILSARYFGSGRNEEQKKILGSFTVALGAAMLCIEVLGITHTQWILQTLDTPEDIISLSARYLSIVLLGIFPLTIYNIYSAVLRGIGNSSLPFRCLAFSGILNVILDVILIGLLKMGVAGAAMATVFAQTLTCLLTVIFAIRKYKMMRFSFRDEWFARAVLIAGLSLALPVTAKSIINSAGSLILQNFMNSFGTVTVAAITTSYRVDCCLLLPVINLGTGISTMVSQSVGAGDSNRARSFLKRGILLMLAVSVTLAVVIWFAGGALVSIFGISPEAVQIGRSFFKRIGAFYPVFGLSLCFSGFLEGYGDVLFSSAASVTALIIRIILSYALVGFFGNMVIAWAEIISWCCLLGIMFLRYKLKRRAL